LWAFEDVIFPDLANNLPADFDLRSCMHEGETSIVRLSRHGSCSFGCSARLALQPCGSSSLRRLAASRQYRFPALAARGHRAAWKSRRTGKRVLRYVFSMVFRSSGVMAYSSYTSSSIAASEEYGLESRWWL
jgi:hypothetical protein